MPCGCQSACGCDVVGDGVTADVARLGDTFTVSSIQAVMGVADTDCIELDVDLSKILTATPVFAVAAVEDASVELRCAATGLVGDVIIDPASTAIVTTTPDGLRVDVTAAPAIPSGRTPGETTFYMGLDNPTGWLDQDGSDVPRAAYANLHDALSLMTMVGTRVATSDLIDAVPNAKYLRSGMPVEATGFVPGTTVVSVTGPSQIQVSTTALSSGFDTEVRVYPHGDGDGFSTFSLPNCNDSYPRGYDQSTSLGPGLGDAGGGAVTILSTNLPLHSHGAGSLAVGLGITGASSVTSPTTDAGGHDHTPGTASRNFVTAEAGAGPGFAITNVTMDQNGGGAQYIIVVDNGGTQQRNNHVTSFVLNHFHSVGFTGAAIAGLLNLTDGSVSGLTGDAGSATPTPVEIDPKHLVGRWMVHT